MINQIAFIAVTLVAAGVFAYSASLIYANIKMLKKAYPLNEVGKRLKMLFEVGFLQKKITR